MTPQVRRREPHTHTHTRTHQESPLYMNELTFLICGANAQGLFSSFLACFFFQTTN